MALKQHIRDSNLEFFFLGEPIIVYRKKLVITVYYNAVVFWIKKDVELK
jgi:hypothetical protein